MSATSVWDLVLHYFGPGEIIRSCHLDAVESRTSPAPELDEAETGVRMRKAQDLAAKYHVEVLPRWAT